MQEVQFVCRAGLGLCNLLTYINCYSIYFLWHNLLTDFLEQLQALKKLDDDPVIVVLDGKNNVGTFAGRLIEEGYNIAHFYAQPNDGKLEMNRHGRDTTDEAYGKDDDYSETCREEEIRIIYDQNKRSGVEAIIVPFATCQNKQELYDACLKLKTLMPNVPIIMKGAGLSVDSMFFKKTSLTFARDQLDRRSGKNDVVYSGENGIQMRPIDAYTSGGVFKVAEAIEKLTADKQRGR